VIEVINFFFFFFFKAYWMDQKNDKPVVVTHSCPEIDPPKQQGKSNIYTSPQGMACL